MEAYMYSTKNLGKLIRDNVSCVMTADFLLRSIGEINTYRGHGIRINTGDRTRNLFLLTTKVIDEVGNLKIHPLTKSRNKYTCRDVYSFKLNNTFESNEFGFKVGDDRSTVLLEFIVAEEAISDSAFSHKKLSKCKSEMMALRYHFNGVLRLLDPVFEDLHIIPSNRGYSVKLEDVFKATYMQELDAKITHGMVSSSPTLETARAGLGIDVVFNDVDLFCDTFEIANPVNFTNCTDTTQLFIDRLFYSSYFNYNALMPYLTDASVVLDTDNPGTVQSDGELVARDNIEAKAQKLARLKNIDYDTTVMFLEMLAEFAEDLLSAYGSLMKFYPARRYSFKDFHKQIVDDSFIRTMTLLRKKQEISNRNSLSNLKRYVMYGTRNPDIVRDDTVFDAYGNIVSICLRPQGVYRLDIGVKNLITMMGNTFTGTRKDILECIFTLFVTMSNKHTEVNWANINSTDSTESIRHFFYLIEDVKSRHVSKYDVLKFEYSDLSYLMNNVTTLSIEDKKEITDILNDPINGSSLFKIKNGIPHWLIFLKERVGLGPETEEIIDV